MAFRYATPKNYKFMSNQYDLYRSYIRIFDLLDTDEKREKFVEILRDSVGNTVCDELKKYMFEHKSKSQLLNLL